MMKAKDYIYKHYGVHKTSDLPNSFDFDNVLDMMKHYSRKKCKEQRELCGDHLVVTEPAGIYIRDELKTRMRNAPEPEIE